MSPALHTLLPESVSSSNIHPTYTSTCSLCEELIITPTVVESFSMSPTGTSMHASESADIRPTYASTCSLCDTLTPTGTDSIPMHTLTTTTINPTTIPVPHPTTDDRGNEISLGERLSTLPLWIWIAVIIAVLFLFALCLIVCTIYFYVKKSKSAQPPRKTQSSREGSSTFNLVDDAASSLEILHPISCSQGMEKLQESCPISRWDNLHMSWSRHSSRRKVSTFKPQMYTEEQSKSDDGKVMTNNETSRQLWRTPEPNPPTQSLPSFGNSHNYTDIPGPNPSTKHFSQSSYTYPNDPVMSATSVPNPSMPRESTYTYPMIL